MSNAVATRLHRLASAVPEAQASSDSASIIRFFLRAANSCRYLKSLLNYHSNTIPSGVGPVFRSAFDFVSTGLLQRCGGQLASPSPQSEGSNCPHVPRTEGGLS